MGTPSCVTDVTTEGNVTPQPQQTHYSLESLVRGLTSLAHCVQRSEPLVALEWY